MHKFRTKLNWELALINQKLEIELKTETGNRNQNPEPNNGNSGNLLVEGKSTTPRSDGLWKGQT